MPTDALRGCWCQEANRPREIRLRLDRFIDARKLRPTPNYVFGCHVGASVTPSSSRTLLPCETPGINSITVSHEKARTCFRGTIDIWTQTISGLICDTQAGYGLPVRDQFNQELALQWIM